MVKTVAIVQARLGSTRLPGKVLLPIEGRSVLLWVIDRLRQAKELDKIVVATSTTQVDSAIVEHCQDLRIPCFRGSENDVLGRFVEAARAYNADLIVRVNADNPLVDPCYIDELVNDMFKNKADYESFQLKSGRPIMLTALSFFAEVATCDCLEMANRIITSEFEREHVTLGIYNRPGIFKVKFLNVPAFCEDSNLRLTLDTEEDFELLRKIFASLGVSAETARAEDVVRLINENPGWKDVMKKMNCLNPKSSKK